MAQDVPLAADDAPPSGTTPPAVTLPAESEAVSLPTTKLTPSPAATPGPGPGSRKKLVTSTASVALLAASLVVGVPWAKHALDTVSTDDAYVNSHVTAVAPRIPGQVARVLVDDNNRVHQGDLLIELDPEPYRVQVNIKEAAFDAAEADLVAARFQIRGVISQARSQRFKLDHAIEDVRNQIAKLRASAATLESRQATLSRAQADLERAKGLVAKGALSRQEFDRNEEAFRVSDALVKEALEQVHQIRVSLGLPAEPPQGEDLTSVPPDLDQTFSTVRQALAEMLLSVAPLGLSPKSYNVTPRQMIEEFYQRDPERNIDRIFDELLKDAPAVKQAEARRMQAQRDLDQALLNLRYCSIFAEIDGVVTRRNVNPGNNVQAGQALLALRSISEVWIDANFKETQLADLRIGQRVEIETDMYGSRQRFDGRISGFTMGTGSTLALLPPQNATGNFVKVVQRLPVRIELENYDPDQLPLFVGLSVIPTVYFREPATGPHAGEFLQPRLDLPRAKDESGAADSARPDKHAASEARP